MIGMQYKINLPADYNMQIIKERIKNNGNKTDNFDSLKFKFYLITEKNKNENIQNSYSPLYLWKDETGMNKFLFDGFYDNILNSFGWQNINIGIPLIMNFNKDIKKAKYVIEFSDNIKPEGGLIKIKETILDKLSSFKNNLGFLIIYNPDKWTYNSFLFLDNLNENYNKKIAVYNVLHISSDSDF